MTAGRSVCGLEMAGVVFRFQEPLLEGVNLRVDPGEVVALCGPNGSGKSTLLKVAVGLLRPLAGSASCGGMAVGSWGRTARAKRVAYLPQNPLLPEGWSVAEVVALGDYPHTARFSALRPHVARPPAPRPLRLRLEEVRQRFHLDGLWDRAVETLSGGERRRVLLARTLVQDTPALVLDEPAADLDLRHQVELFRHLGALAAEGRAILMTSHDLNLSLLFGQRIVLLDGMGGAQPLPEDAEGRARALEGAYRLKLGRVDWEGTSCYLPVTRNVNEKVEGEKP